MLQTFWSFGVFAYGRDQKLLPQTLRAITMGVEGCKTLKEDMLLFKVIKKTDDTLTTLKIVSELGKSVSLRDSLSEVRSKNMVTIASQVSDLMAPLKPNFWEAM